MCGIVGLVDFGEAVDAARISAAAHLLRRRGPDDAGSWSEGGVGFAHRRLSILDLSPAGHQPMLSPDGRFVVVLNGEIYNFEELRSTLDPGLKTWRSESDTEVLLAAYARWGAMCVERFHGMFAFAIWDRAERHLFAARDRMGVKPFFYHAGASRLAFSSRPSPLFEMCTDLSRELDEQAIRLYLECGYVPAPWSIYRAVRKLPPGHWLQFDAENGLRVNRYWDFRALEPDASWKKRHEADLLDELEEIASRCVKSRLIADVPVGAFLSGGIDSSIVAALMARGSSSPVRTFTIGFREKSHDESMHALAVARHLGTEHSAETLGVNDLLQLVPLFLDEFDEPFSDASAFPTMAVSRLARQQVTVSLSGDGGDELFAGYHYYAIAQRLAPAMRAPAPVREVMASVAGMVPAHRSQLVAATLRRPDGVAAFAFTRGVSKDFGSLLLPEVLARTHGIEELFRKAARSFAFGLEPAEAGMRLDMLYTLPDDYLQKVDLSSMAFSLESREPLLDQDLIEWAMRLPLKWKLRGKAGKYLLRKLGYRLVPREILDRPKQGFAVPIADWLRGPLRAWMLERITNTALFQKVPIDQDAVQRVFALHDSGRRNAYPILWAILILLEFVTRLSDTTASTASGRAGATSIGELRRGIDH